MKFFLFSLSFVNENLTFSFMLLKKFENSSGGGYGREPNIGKNECAKLANRNELLFQLFWKPINKKVQNHFKLH